MSWHEQLNSDSTGWLLEEDLDNPAIRFFALKDLLDLPSDDPEVKAAQRAVMTSGSVPVILENQHPEGWWDRPGAGYYPKYTGTVWSVTFLAQLGADGSDERVRRGCEQVLEHNRAPYGGFSFNGKNGGMVQCMQGNLCAALIDLGWQEDARLQGALGWLVRSVTGEGIAPAEEKKAEVRFYRSGNSAPGFACSANNHLPCAWGAIKTMLALSRVPVEVRTPTIQRAIEMGVEFLFSRDPADADYPMGYSEKPNRSWFRFGYPIGYITDVLQNLEVLIAFGYGNDPRLEKAVQLLLGKQDAHGRWKLEYTYNGKTWVDVEQKGQPSKWVTLRALRVLKQVDTR
jgi:hypothetical protein